MDTTPGNSPKEKSPPLPPTPTPTGRPRRRPRVLPSRRTKKEKTPPPPPLPSPAIPAAPQVPVLPQKEKTPPPTPPPVISVSPPVLPQKEKTHPPPPAPTGRPGKRPRVTPSPRTKEETPPQAPPPVPKEKTPPPTLPPTIPKPPPALPQKEKTPPPTPPQMGNLPPPASPGALHSLVYNGTRVEVVQQDMTLFPIEAIVNAANTRLQGGAGVDGAIHRAAGPGLLVELRQLYPNGGVDGGAYHTGAHNIRTTQHIIHTIGPNYRAYEAQGRAAAAHPVLFDAYANSMREAANRGIRSISFPTLSTGIFAFPGEDACKIALSAVKQILDEARVAGYQFERVVFLVWQPTGVPSDLRHYNKHFAGV